MAGLPNRFWCAEPAKQRKIWANNLLNLLICRCTFLRLKVWAGEKGKRERERDRREKMRSWKTTWKMPGQQNIHTYNDSSVSHSWTLYTLWNTWQLLIETQAKGTTMRSPSSFNRWTFEQPGHGDENNERAVYDNNAFCDFCGRACFHCSLWFFSSSAPSGSKKIWSWRVTTCRQRMQARNFMARN